MGITELINHIYSSNHQSIHNGGTKMDTKKLLRRLTCTLTMLSIAMWAPSLLHAQDYGVGETIVVPQVSPASVTIDGEYEADVWDTGALVDMLVNVDWWNESYPDVDVDEAYARVLFSRDTLYIFAVIDENELFFHEEGWMGDQIRIGIDPIHEAGVTDQLVDQDDWAGWPDNAPADGPYAYTVTGGDAGGLKLWWGYSDTDPVAEGWAEAAVWTNEDEQSWGVEAKLYVPGLEPGAEIGFNIGGATGVEASGEPYGYFSRWSTENPGGDIMSRTDSYGTLRMAGGGGEGYGSGFVLQVPHVEPGSIVIDGVADEEAWESAQTDIDVTAHWNSYGPVGEATPEADLFGETKLLWSDDTLYVSHRLFDPLLFFQEEDFWGSDMILIGIDNSHEGDSLFDPNFGGGVANAPEGVYTYFINPIAGFTFAWNEEIVPSDTGWVNAVVYQDEDQGEWGLEAAIYVPAIELDAEIGFDIGGAQASPDQCGEGYCDYAYFAWQTGAEVEPGNINRNATYWATLQMVTTLDDTSIEPVDEIPTQIALRQNYPNPFNPSTNIEFEIDRAGHVQLEVFNLLGQRVAALVDAPTAAGTYRYTWNGADLPSGMYVYQLRVDDQLISSRKMMLVK